MNGCANNSASPPRFGEISMRDSILILSGPDVEKTLENREEEILAATEQAYLLHRAGRSAMPGSSFLRFSERPKDRIIALPAYLGGELGVAGIKWIASFPDNISR